MNRSRAQIVGGLALALFALTGCGAARPTQTPIPTRIVPLQEALTARPPLPATWTPVPTFTPLPTRTPILTDTPAPTLSAAQICERFKVVSSPTGRLDYAATGQFIWQNAPSGSFVGVAVRLAGSSSGISLIVPVDGSGVFTFPLTRLPDGENYTWRVSVLSTEQAELCAVEGTFSRAPKP